MVFKSVQGVRSRQARWRDRVSYRRDRVGKRRKRSRDEEGECDLEGVKRWFGAIQRV